MFPKIGNFSNSAYYSKPYTEIFPKEPKVFPRYGKIYTLPRPYYSQYPNPVSNEKSYYLEKNQKIREKSLEKQLIRTKNQKLNIEKEKIRDELSKLYNFHISNNELRQLSYEQLLTKVVKIHQKFKENTAALIIQESWKNYILRKDPNYMKRIQLARRLAKIKSKKYNQQEAATVIQRIYRGYRVRLEFMLTRGKHRINQTISFFDDVKTNLIRDSAKVIWKYWVAYRDKKRKIAFEKEQERLKALKEKQRKEAEELKKLQAKKTMAAKEPANTQVGKDLRRTSTMVKSPKKK